MTVNPNPVLQKYYASIESRIGYRLFLGGTRHFGYYPSSRSSPFPIDKALRAMEAKLYDALGRPEEATMLDAGCGDGYVALYMAGRGKNRVECIDVVERHVARTKKNIVLAGMQELVTARVCDYHHLKGFSSSSFDCIYTIETFVHCTDPFEVLQEFLRLLRPGGCIALHEYDHDDLDKAPKKLADAMRKVNEYASMPANASFDRDALKHLLEQAGFEAVELKDISEHVVPMMWLFYIFAIVPYLFLKFLGMDHHFVNTVAGAEMYRGRSLWRYIQVTGKKRI